MKNTILVLFFLASFCQLSLSQDADQAKTIYLKDGSFLLGKILNSTDDEVLQIELNGGTILNVNKSQVLTIADQKKGMHLLTDGRKIKNEGWYASGSVHTLTARQALEFPEKTRLTTGMHISSGYYFNQYLGIGIGGGFDLHERLFIPTFLEFNGQISNNKTPHKGVFKTQIPVTYSLQLGYNFPINEKDNEFEELTGSWMAYPAVGLLFGTRRGPSIKLDFGYKFQRYKREYFNDWWWNEYTTKDTVLLKSLAVRGSLIF